MSLGEESGFYSQGKTKPLEHFQQWGSSMLWKKNKYFLTLCVVQMEEEEVWKEFELSVGSILQGIRIDLKQTEWKEEIFEIHKPTHTYICMYIWGWAEDEHFRFILFWSSKF